MVGVGLVSSSAIGMTPLVGVFVAVEGAEGVESFEGDDWDSPRRSACVEGESLGARCDLRLCFSIICIAQSSKSTGVLFAAAMNMSLS